MKRGVLVILVGVVLACTSATPTIQTTSAQPTYPPTNATSATSAVTRPTSPSPTPASTPSPTPTATQPPASTPASEEPPTPSVRLMAVGDVMLGWQVGRKIVRKGPAAPWVRVKSYLDQADLVVANLECVISKLGEP